jgi:hypothetical protein
VGHRPGPSPRGGSTVTKLLFLAVGIVVGIPCILGFAKWERQGKAIRAVVLILALELLESGLYQDQNAIPRGLFHPGSGSTQLRLPEILITLALLGRLVAKRMPRSIGYPAMIWAAFALWLTVELVEGYIRVNTHSQILYEGKAIIYVGGGFALAAGVPMQRYLEAEVFERLTRWFAPFVLVLDLLAVGNKSFSAHLPLLPLSGFGTVGADAATMFAGVGLIALLLELGKEQRNAWTMTCTLPLLGCAFLASQRAALFGLLASVVVLVLVGFGSIARRRLLVHLTEVLLALSLFFVLVLAFVLVPALVDQQAPKIPFVSTFHTELYSTGKAESAQDRINEFEGSRHLIPQHLLIGWGLGVTYEYWTPGPNLEVTSPLTEDIYTDLWLRTGIVGLGLFVVAVLVSLGGGLAVWRRDPNRLAAVFALALVAVVLGFLVKGGFESIFEKYRLATTLGLLLGMLRSTVTSPGRTLHFSPAAHTGRNSIERV